MRTAESRNPLTLWHGSELEAMNDDALARIGERADIFTRVTPAQKNRIMNALKANRHVVRLHRRRYQ